MALSRTVNLTVIRAAMTYHRTVVISLIVGQRDQLAPPDQRAQLDPLDPLDRQVQLALPASQDLPVQLEAV